MPPTLLNLRPVYVFMTAAFCLHHTACISSASDASASTQVATAAALSGGQVPKETPTWLVQLRTLRLIRDTHHDCDIGNSVPTEGSQTVIKTEDYNSKFYIYPHDEFRGLKILLHGRTGNSTLEYPKYVICFNESLKWYEVDISFPFWFGDDKAVVELTTNFCSLKCVTEIKNTYAYDIKGTEVVAVGPASWTNDVTPAASCNLQATSNNKEVLPKDKCNQSIDPNPTTHSSTTTPTPHRASKTATPHTPSTTTTPHTPSTTTTPHRPSTTTTPHKSSTTTLPRQYLILILVVVALVVVVAVVLVVMVVRRRRSSRGSKEGRGEATQEVRMEEMRPSGPGESQSHPVTHTNRGSTHDSENSLYVELNNRGSTHDSENSLYMALNNTGSIHDSENSLYMELNNRRSTHDSENSLYMASTDSFK